MSMTNPSAPLYNTGPGGYITVPFNMTPDSNAALALDFLAANIPGFKAVEGKPEVWLAEVFGLEAAQVAAVAATVPLAVFAYLGSLLGMTPAPAVAATTTTTWTVANTAGYVIPQGTVIGWQQSGQTILFQTTQAVSIPVGSQSVSGVIVQAVTPGNAANGLGPGAWTMVDSLSFVTAITSTAPTSGGADPQTVQSFVNQLSQQLSLMTARPILPQDFALISQSVPGVARAVALDQYSPGRSVTDGATTAGSTTFTSNSAAFITSDVGRAVTSTSVANATFTDGATTSGSTTLTSNTGQFVSTDQGLTITGSGIPTGTTIASVTNATTVALSAAATATATGVSFTIDSRPVLPPGVTITAVSNSSTATLSAPASATSTAESVTFGALTGVERCCTVCAVDVNGDALSGTVLANLESFLQAQREVNFLVSVISPTFTPISVTATVAALPTASINAVQAACVSALRSYLSPANWGGGNLTPPTWVNETTVRYLEVAAILGNVPGVDYVQTLLIGPSGALAASDYQMPGVVPLPQVGTLSINVVPD